MKVYKGRIKKKITIKLVGDAEQAFNGLNKIVGEQRSQGITSSKDITLLTDYLMLLPITLFMVKMQRKI